MPDGEYERPEGVDDAAVEALGKVSEGMEYIERARGRLYDFHQLIGRADLVLGEAADQLAAAGYDDLAERLREQVVGRNVVQGRWTFQVVDEFDDGYWAAARALDEAARALVGGRRHVFEAELKDRRRTGGRAGHERRP